jgi:alkanesulfonate monooxygenase SsuD/methylene tetrahydromethanopterin reductase-like flavin-dependent oxidoreductase (luciferase family)
VPGLGSLSTWEFAARHNHCYCFLSYYGPKAGRGVMDGFWQFIDERGIEPNPFRAGFLQLVAVAESDAKAEQLYEKHMQYFYNKSLHIPPEFFFPPGHQDYRSLENNVRKGIFKSYFDKLDDIPNWKFKDFVDEGFVIAGGPSTVRDLLTDAIKKLRIGNLMVLLHIGSMPHELTLKNIDMFTREVMPHIHDTWDAEWENHWWPEKLRTKRQSTLAAL